MPRAVDDGGFTVEPDPRTDGWMVVGVRPERWVRQTDFSNDEAVGYLADRLNRLGVEIALAKAGAQPGDAITVGDVTFDWEPTLPAGTLTVEETAGLGGRGTDVRLENNARPRADERLAAKRSRRTPYELSSRRTTTSWGRRVTPGGRRRGAPGRGQGRLLLPDHAAHGLDTDRLRALVDVLAALRAAGREVVLVSSGAIAAGLAPLGSAAAPATWRPPRPPPASASSGSCRPTPTPSPGTASPSARCC